MSVGTVGSVVLGTLRLGFYGLNGVFLFTHIFPSWVFKEGKRINNGELFNYANHVIHSYGIKKEVTLIEGTSTYFGTRALPGAAVLVVTPKATLTEKTKADIETDLALLSLNQGLINYIIPIVIAIAARSLFINQSPMQATLAELGFGTIALVVNLYGFKYAADQMRKKRLLDHQG